MGYTDDRTKIWAASLNSDRLFIFDVSDQMNPKLIRTIDNVAKTTGLSGPHTPYAIPGRILISMASGPNGSGPGGIAEFTNDGDFVASHPTDNHPYETVIKPEFNRMITSSWFPQKTFMALARQVEPGGLVQPRHHPGVGPEVAQGDPDPERAIPINLAARWMLKPGAKYGYAISSGRQLDLDVQDAG